MKATKKIVGAACALVAAVALSAGSTFAWFSSNGTVRATGLTVEASTSNAYLIIGKTTADLDKNLTSITMDSPSDALKPSAYIAADYNAETDTQKAEGDTWAATTLNDADATCIDNVSQWYTGVGIDANNGALKDNKVKIAEGEFSQYVVIQDIVVSISGTTPVNNVNAKMTYTATNESALSCPIKVVFLYQKVAATEGANPTYGTVTTWTKEEVKASTGWESGIDLGGIASPKEHIAIKVLVYMNGNDADVKTANSGNLTGCSLAFDFVDQAASA